MLMRILTVLFLILFHQSVLASAHHAAIDSDDIASAESVEIKVKDDPLEKMNRKVQVFNDVLDKYLLKPVAKGYDFITPKVVNKGITNIFATISEIPNAANALLQWDLKGTGTSLSRFFINISIGGLGFFDVATKFGLEEQPEDFGQTLAVWGVPSGPYLVLPFFGPSNLRDSGSLIVDLYLNPLNYEYADPAVRNGVWVTKIVDRRADLFKVEELVNGSRYIFFKNTYQQQRNYLINNGDVVDNFGDEDLDDDEWLE